MKSWIFIIILVLVAYIIYRNFTSEGKAPARQVDTVKTPSDIALARQTEAKNYAHLLSNSQEEYFAINSTYALDIRDLKITMHYGQNYSAKVISANTSDYEIEIRGNIDADPTEDVWKLTKNGTVNLINDVTMP